MTFGETALLELVSVDPSIDVPALATVLGLQVVTLRDESRPDPVAGQLWGGSLDGCHVLSADSGSEVLWADAFDEHEAARVLPASEAICPGWRPWIGVPDPHALQQIFDRAISWEDMPAVPIHASRQVPGWNGVRFCQLLDPFGLRLVLCSGLTGGVPVRIKHSTPIPDVAVRWYYDLGLSIDTALAPGSAWIPTFAISDMHGSVKRAVETGTFEQVVETGQGYHLSTPAGASFEVVGD